MVVNAVIEPFIKTSKPECMMQAAPHSFVSVGKINGLLRNFRDAYSYSSFSIDRTVKRSCILSKRTQSQPSAIVRPKCIEIQSMPNENVADLDADENDDELCPVDCVREFQTQEEFSRILSKSVTLNALVVVDFYRTSCGSCKYIEQGFAKLCKGTAENENEVPIVFLKHNVLDEYDEQTEVAENLRIRVFRFSISTKMESSWKHLQQEIKSEYSKRYVGTQL